MKKNKAHTVPLSTGALQVLNAARWREHADGSGLVFPSVRGGGQIHDATLSQLLRSLGLRSTVHGMRSTFRDWAAESGVDNTVAELALAHDVGSATERAYRRSDLVEARRAVMEKWADAIGCSDPF